MAKRKIEIFSEVNDAAWFFKILKKNTNKLICAEIYCSYAGSCTCLDRLFATIKLDWSNGEMILLKVLVDDIEVLKRFWNQSEPIYMFILNNRVTKVFRGVNSMQLAMVAKNELLCFKNWQAGQPCDRPTYNLDEITPDEIGWHEKRATEKLVESEKILKRRAARQAERKRHRAELMVPFLKHLNFVLYWPHMKHAHPELYERWDENNIIMVGREELQLTKDKALDILYAGDAELNEASLHALLSAPALAICFRLLDTDKHFVCGYLVMYLSLKVILLKSAHNHKEKLIFLANVAVVRAVGAITQFPLTALVRQILYKDLPPLEETMKPEEQLPQRTAFDTYKSYSLSREQIMKQREELKAKRRAEIAEQRARRLSEMQRMARQAIADALQERKNEREKKKLELLKAGNLDELKKLKDEPMDEEVGIVVPEELPDAIEEDSSSEDEDEYFPPPGLLVPGLYSPPNDVAKSNGLAILFPRLVQEQVIPQPEFLPPHVLVSLAAAKRHRAVKALAKYRKSIIHMGIFKVISPSKAKHLAYSVKQFDALDLPVDEDTKIIFMLSTATDFALLELMDLLPDHVSRNEEFGEEESAAVFPVNYGDEYDEFEDFEKHDE